VVGAGPDIHRGKEVERLGACTGEGVSQDAVDSALSRGQLSERVESYE
jgi:hypothetical protein